MNTRPLLIGLAVLAIPGLSGCVAAIPAVAVLAMGGSQIDDKDSVDNKKVTVIRPAAPVTGPSATTSVSASTSAAGSAQSQGPAQPPLTPAPAPETDTIAEAAPTPVAPRQIVDAKPQPSTPSLAAQRPQAVEALTDQGASVDGAPSAQAAASPKSAPQKPLAVFPVEKEPAPRPVEAPVERPVEFARLDVPKPDAPTPAARPVPEPAPQPVIAKPDPAPLADVMPRPLPDGTQALASSAVAPRNIGPELLKPSTSPGYDQFAGFVEDRSTDFNLGRGMKSVVYISDSGLENPTFAQCGEKPLAIILDLDNNELTDEQNAAIWRGAIDPAPGVLNAVNEARRLNITVFYMSSQLAQSGIRIEAALNEAGLGPAEPGIQLWLKGERGLERKDLLRQVISRHYCVVAMAGDRKSDFADFYDYLRDPNTPAVRTLDPLFNAGWFMLPNPVVAAHSNDKD